MANNKKGGSIFTLVVLALLLFGAYRVWGPNTGSFVESEYLYIRTGSDYEAVKRALEDGDFISDMFSFHLLAKARKLPARIRPGKYKIEKGMSNFDIIRLLRNGKQTPVKLVINKLRTKKDLIRILDTNLEPDSITFSQLLQDPSFTSEYGLDTNTVMALILPDTYEFFWNTSASNALKTIGKNYKRFWDTARVRQATALGLTPAKVTIIASIVDEETNKTEDKPKIASVYLNRIKIGMALQADPTVKFAIGDFTIRRITGKMLEVNSPYNTYMHAGIPPGPICTPSFSSIDAVLNAPKTNYLYFCAKEDFSGYSNFASTFEQQIRNARAYQRALNARGIH
ncbi:MAG: mltG [Flavipsychrobacter sp.]|jgi:UPF0755 protein|nr:mltG [Flavipsychrobacter sp.]